MADESGFTLLEMLITILLVSLLATLGIGAISSAQDRAVAAQAGAKVERLLSGARDRALRGAERIVVSFDASRRTFRNNGLEAGEPIDPRVDIEFVGAREIDGAAVPSIVFLADGSSTGGEIRLKARSNSRVLRVDWLTGAIRHER